jgi:HAD superfamily hydrolase (TIGR01509 family)
LAPGAIDFINELVEANIPIAIATSSDKSNIEFYLEVFELNNWFPYERVIYDDGKMLGKPAPDIYIRALKSLKIKPNECIVFEDTMNGINAARNAQIEKVILIQSGNHLGITDFQNIQAIDDFIEMDLKLLENI